MMDYPILQKFQYTASSVNDIAFLVHFSDILQEISGLAGSSKKTFFHYLDIEVLESSCKDQVRKS